MYIHTYIFFGNCSSAGFPVRYFDGNLEAVKQLMSRRLARHSVVQNAEPRAFPHVLVSFPVFKSHWRVDGLVLTYYTCTYMRDGKTHICIHPFIHACIHTYICTYMYVHMYVCKYKRELPGKSWKMRRQGTCVCICMYIKERSATGCLSKRSLGSSWHLPVLCALQGRNWWCKWRPASFCSFSQLEVRQRIECEYENLLRHVYMTPF